eukprot:4870239-Pyramimonas_sp.AAC.1
MGSSESRHKTLSDLPWALGFTVDRAIRLRSSSARPEITCASEPWTAPARGPAAKPRIHLRPWASVRPFRRLVVLRVAAARAFNLADRPLPFSGLPKVKSEPILVMREQAAPTRGPNSLR